MHKPILSWHNILPKMFTNPRFYQISCTCYEALINGVRAGIVIAARPVTYDYYVLDKLDSDALWKLKCTNVFGAAFVAAADEFHSRHTYVNHVDEKIYETLRIVPPFRKRYWLLRPDMAVVGEQVSFQFNQCQVQRGAPTRPLPPARLPAGLQAGQHPDGRPGRCLTSHPAGHQRLRRP
jgi:hypothetical protein